MASSATSSDASASAGAGVAPLALQTRAALLEASRVFDEAALRRALERLADCGWNTVVMPAFVGGYPLFHSKVWKTQGLRPQHPAFRKWAPFDVASDAAWRLGLNLIVSHQPYLVGEGLGRWRRPPLPRKYPKWLAMRHPKRKRRLSEESAARTYYCPVNRDLRRFLCDTLHVLLEDYPFQGLLVDLRHYPFRAGGEGNYLPWCYCTACREATLRDLGFDPADVDFTKEAAMVERWKEWQAVQMDTSLAYMRMRVLKARRTMRVMGLLTTDSGLSPGDMKPLIHWRTWVERSLVEALVLDTYSPDPSEFSSQLHQDIETLPRSSLLLPTLPRQAENADPFLQLLDMEPVPGFVSRFSNWDQPDFDPSQRACFDAPAASVEADPVGSIGRLFEQIGDLVPEESEFLEFLGDLGRILTRSDATVTIERLTMVISNLQGLHDRVAEGQLAFGPSQDQILHHLDLAVRLTYLACCDLIE